MKVYAANGNLIGDFDGKVLYKKVRKSEHMFRKAGPNGGWGIDYKALHSLPDDGKIAVCDVETMTKYTATVEKWREEGKVFHFKDEKLNHFPQRFLPIEAFTIKQITK